MMNEFGQILEGGVGALVFYLVYVLVNIIRDAVAGKAKMGKNICGEHAAVCVHLETLVGDVSQIKGNVMQLVRDIAIIQGRLDA
jgi:hypothetical protein